MKLWSREPRDESRGPGKNVGEAVFSSPRPSPLVLRPRQAGLTLIECLVYIALLGLLLNLATHAFFKCLENSRDLQRNADDVVRALQAGERWRADVRQATATPRLSENNGESLLHVPQQNGKVVYISARGKVWRDAGGRPGRQVFLADVARSEMVVDRRERVSAWRWELELQTRKSVARVRPLFTFLAVPKTEAKR